MSACYDGHMHVSKRDRTLRLHPALLTVAVCGAETACKMTSALRSLFK